MLKVLEKAAEAHLTIAEALEVLKALAERGYKGVGFAKLESMAAAFGLPLSDKLVSASGAYVGETEVAPVIDVFLDGQTKGVLFLRHDRSETFASGEEEEDEVYTTYTEPDEFTIEPSNFILVAGIGTDSPSAGAKLDDFCAKLTEAIKEQVDGRRVRGMKLTWKPRAPRGRDLSRFLKSAQRQGARYEPPEYDANEAVLANALASPDLRKKLLEVMRQTKVRTADMLQGDSEATRGIIDKLTGLALLSREYLLVCSKSGQGLARLQSKEDITGSRLKALSCGQCGRPLMEERVDEILIPTGQARKLSEGSRWMRIVFTNTLIEEGISRDQIVWNLSQNGEDVDVIASIMGRLVFVELKDREFGLGDAYPFSSRVARYGGDVGIIVTADKVAQDAKKFFEEQAKQARYYEGPRPPPSIRFIEDFDPSSRALPNLLDGLSLGYLTRRLRQGIPAFRLTRAIDLMMRPKE